MQTFFLAAMALPVLAALDFLWVGLVGSGFYRSELGEMLRPDALLAPAALFYVLYALALVHFAVAPAVAAQSARKALLSGALFGLAAYATYGLTNLATLSGWPLSVSAADIAWGAALSALASVLAYLVATLVFYL